MEIKLFTDLIDALGKVVGGLKAILDLSTTEREKIRKTLEETYRLIDTTLNMVIIRLGDILQEETDANLLHEAARLDNYDEWIQAEREFRICRSLRVALRETETLSTKLAGKASAKDWQALKDMMGLILATEGEVAVFISQRFDELAKAARDNTPGSQPASEVRKRLATFRADLVTERRQLIQQEIELFDIV
jgi:hypothetical protein